ncbi:Short-chain type dehydrogenase/reductase [Candida viswanathii]|uniref:Short-chain type dehydrogenase/reductase n=1 Tax=Candida viswanathii TaxID=5486 RepID=A0A367YIY5_9ASCO|nr:Short-chain type dehydrogenase/reductase [Candida viswanathii]
MSLSGKTSLIAAGTKNLGGASAKELAKAGSNLFLHYRSNPDEAEKFKQEILKEFPNVKVETYQSKLDRAADLTNLFAAAKKAFPSGIDVAVNFVGKVIKGPITEVTEEQFDEMDVANNKIAFFFIKEAAINLNKNGSIISIVTSLLPAYTDSYGLYQGTKGAVEYYSKSILKELIPKGITSNCIGPGPASTSFLFNSETKESVEFFKTVAIDQRLTEDSDIAPIVLFLATGGRWATGQTIYASGGFTAR